MKIARSNSQLEMELNVLPSYELIKNAQSRNGYGSAAQYLSCAALGLDGIAIDGSKDVCFDAEKDGQFYEIKSVRKGGKVVIYDFRMEKEQATGLPLKYLIFVHKLKGVKSSEELWSTISQTEFDILLIDARTIHKFASQCPLNKIKKIHGGRCGYAREGYIRGYRNLPVKQLRQISWPLEKKKFTFCNIEFTANIFTDI